MNRYSYIKAIGLSLYSEGFYRDVARRWKGLGLVFMLLMIIIFGGGTALVQTITFRPERAINEGFAGASFQSLTNTVFLSIINEFPEIIIENGVARTDVPQPYIIKNPYSQDPFMIIDTTGKVTSLAGSAAVALITDKAFITKSGKKDIVRADFAKIEDGVINKEALMPVMRWLPLIMLPSNMIYMFIFLTVNAFVLGGAGLLISNVLKTGLTFKDVVRLAVVTTTPLLMLEGIQAVLGVRIFKNAMLVYFLLHAAYLYHALDACRPGAKNQQLRR
jgi:hypothetical protein